MTKIYRNFALDSKRFVHIGMGTIDSIMALKYYLGLKYVHGSRFLGQLKDKIFVLKTSITLPRSDVDLVKHLQVGGNIEKSWMMFDHVKRLKNSTTLVGHV